MAHQVTTKGQVTIPKRVREYLGIQPGSGVEFEVGPQGDVLLRKAGRPSKRARSRGRFAALRGTPIRPEARTQALSTFGALGR